jgi:hypothetical protein
MIVELRLQQVLDQYGLNWHGVEQNIANSCGMHRHTVGKMYRGESKNPSLYNLSLICGWLIENGVPANILPEALLGFKPASLWKAVARTTSVTICMGSYNHIITQNKNVKPGPAHMTVALHDAAAFSKISQVLTSEEEMGGARPTVRTQHVPFHFHHNSQEVEGAWFEEDKRSSKRIYQEVMGKVPMNTVMLIGSQRANYLVEHFVSDLFGCQPFVSNLKKPCVPLYLRYRTFDRLVPSCFGGRDNPAWVEKTNKCGIWFPDENNKWQLYEWKKAKQDSGAVITVRSAGSMRIALLGFIGRSTNAICNELIHRPENFWPLDPADLENEDTGRQSAAKKKRRSRKKANPPTTAIRKSSEIGMYICRVKFSEPENNAEPWSAKDFDRDKVEVKPFHKSVLERYLPTRGRSRGGINRRN